MEYTIKSEITELKDKQNYIKGIQKENKNKIVKGFVLVEYKDRKLFLDTTKLGVTKYFFNIPYSGYLIDNSWKHQAFTMRGKLETILANMKLFDADIKEYSKEEALKYLKENFGLEEKAN